MKKHNPLVVLDKSFLYGASRTQLEELGRRYTAVVSDALVMELLTTDSLDRCRCGERLRDGLKDFLIIESIPALLRYELKHQQASTPVVEKVESRAARIGERLCRWKLILKSSEAVAIQTWRSDVDEAVKLFLQEAETIPKLFTSLRSALDHDRKASALELQAKLASDPQPVRDLYEKMDLPGLPEVEQLDDAWALYRRAQVHFFATLEEFGKHGVDVAEKARSEKSLEELRNEVIDFDYRIMGLLVGGLATLDRRSAVTLRTLCPDGVLLDSTWTP